MKKIITLATVAVMALFMFYACKTTKNQSSSKMLNYNDTISYALGVDYAANALQGMASTGETYNTNLFAAGFAEFIKSSNSITPDQAFEILTAHFEKLQAEQRMQRQIEEQLMQSMQEPQEETSNENNMTYLDENAKKAGVKTTASGLQYKVIKEGSGKKPAATNVVRVHYTGKLTNGTVFDSSVGGEPIEFPLNQVIPGWTEGLQLMTVGSKYELTIPSHLGYGAQEIPGVIPANSVLVFEVELLDVK